MINGTRKIENEYFLSRTVATECWQQKQGPGNAKFQDPHPSYRFIVLLISSTLQRFFHSLSRPLGASTGPSGLKCVSCVLGDLCQCGSEGKGRGGGWALCPVAASVELGDKDSPCSDALGMSCRESERNHAPPPF